MNELKPVKIVKIENNKLIFDNNMFLSISKKWDNIKDKKVCVITINGAYRNGKSFLLNFIVNRLLNKEGNYFKWKHGKDPCTFGMWMLNYPIIINNIAIILIDTQGMFDTKLNIKSTITLFSLSTLISSIQIYNIDKRIQEDNLQHLALFSEYAKVLYNNTSKPFQNINLLVRDWQSFTDIRSIDQSKIDAHHYISDIMNCNKNDDIVDTRDQIISCFENITCTLLPHPGFNVSEGKYNGNLDDIRPDFLKHVYAYIDSIKFVPKKVMGCEIKLKELGVYLQNYCNILQNNNIPDPDTILNTTIEVVYLNAMSEALQFYQNKLYDFLKDKKYKSRSAIQNYNITITRQSVDHFNKKAVMGSEKKKIEARNMLIMRMKKYYGDYMVLYNKKHNTMYNKIYLLVIMVLLWILKFVTSDPCTLYACYTINHYISFLFYLIIAYVVYEMYKLYKAFV